MARKRIRSIPQLSRLAAVFVAVSTASAQEYDFILVDSFNPNYGLRETYLWDINELGVACGVTTRDNTIGYPGITWDHSTGKTVIPVSWPHGINNHGRVVGNLAVYDTASGRSFSPPLLPGTYIGPNFSGVNDAGVAVGMIQTCNCSNSGGFLQIPYIWDEDNGARTVSVPGAKGLSRINNAGVAIGWTGGNSAFDGFFVDIASGAYTTMNSVFPPAIGLGPTRAFDINDAGEIVGTRIGTAPVYFYGYVYSPETGVRILPFAGGPYQDAVKPLGINNFGTIVGEIYIGGSSRAFVYTDSDGIRDLNSAALVTGILPGFTLMTAQKVSDRGWIVGYGYGGGGMYKSFVLVPRAVPGDLNCDGVVSVGDIGAFVIALSSPAGYAAQFPNCNISHGDINGDGAVSVGDIGPFVTLLSR